MRRSVAFDFKIGLGSPEDIQAYGSDALLLTLSSLTRHLVTSLHSQPTLGALADSLRLSLATRTCFYDYLHQVAYKSAPARQTGRDDVDVTAVTCGLAPVGGDWHIDSWVTE
jgi:hypothetical protein